MAAFRLTKTYDAARLAHFDRRSRLSGLRNGKIASEWLPLEALADGRLSIPKPEIKITDHQIEMLRTTEAKGSFRL